MAEEDNQNEVGGLKIEYFSWDQCAAVADRHPDHGSSACADISADFVVEWLAIGRPFVEVSEEAWRKRVQEHAKSSRGAAIPATAIKDAAAARLGPRQSELVPPQHCWEPWVCVVQADATGSEGLLQQLEAELPKCGPLCGVTVTALQGNSSTGKTLPVMFDEIGWVLTESHPKMDHDGQPLGMCVAKGQSIPQLVSFICQQLLPKLDCDAKFELVFATTWRGHVQAAIRNNPVFQKIVAFGPVLHSLLPGDFLEHDFSSFALLQAMAIGLKLHPWRGHVFSTLPQFGDAPEVAILKVCVAVGF